MASTGVQFILRFIGTVPMVLFIYTVYVIGFNIKHGMRLFNLRGAIFCCALLYTISTTL